MRGGIDGWAWLIVGLLWLSLTGACTFNLYQTDEGYGFWAIGVYVVMLGLIPFSIGLRRVAGAAKAGWVLILVAGLWLAATLVMIGRSLSRDAGELLIEGLLALGPPAAFILWGWRMLRTPSAKTGKERS